MNDDCCNKILGHVKVTTGTVDAVIESIGNNINNANKAYCIPINVTKYSMAKTDEKLRQAILAADYVTADGVPIRWLSRRAGEHNVHRITGIDLAEACLDRAAADGWTVFLFGTKAEHLQRAQSNLLEKHPSLSIVGTQDGYFKEDEIPEIIAKINDASPDLLLLGIGLPQKEHFIYDYFDRLNFRFGITVGGAIDIWADAKQRAPVFIQSIGMEWLYRSVGDIKKSIRLFAHIGTFSVDLLLCPKLKIQH